MSPDPHNTWSADAQRSWTRIPADKQQLLLSNVWCGHCRAMRTMILQEGHVVAGDLAIAGPCAVCGQRTARLLEGEPLLPVTLDTLQPGDAVVWLQHEPGGGYLGPRDATVVRCTPTKVILHIDDTGQAMTRTVSVERVRRRGTYGASVDKLSVTNTHEFERASDAAT